MGPEDARSVAALRYYASVPVTANGTPVRVARTGYTGEDGFEFFCPAEGAEALWRLTLEKGASSGIAPCGLASRDTLRLEAGMPLYGHELSLMRTPFEARLGRVVHFGGGEDPRADFIGRAALQAAGERVRAWEDAPDSAPDDTRLLVGLVGESKRSARGGYPVYGPEGVVGEVTSGAPSPTLRRPIAMAYVHPRYISIGERVEVDVRGRREGMTVTALPFYSRQE
jgi:aminomethyltransferase